MNVGGGLPYYVVGKDMKKNEVYVTTEISNQKLWSKELNLVDAHWINHAPRPGDRCQVRTRHRAPLVGATVQSIGKSVVLELDDEIRACTPGQSAVLYQETHCMGGGIII